MSETTAKQRAAVWVAVVFLLGAALGGVVGYIFAHRAVSANMTVTVSQRRAQRVEELTRMAHLTPDQRQQLEGILSDLHAQYKTLDDERDDARQKSRSKIRGILTQDQIPGFEEFLRKIDEERKRMTPPQ
jgi:predicted Holliday junction resolvase-like endonuclease